MHYREPRESAPMDQNRNTNIMLLLMAEYIVIVIRIPLPVKCVRTFQRRRRDRMFLRHVSPLLLNKEQTAPLGG